MADSKKKALIQAAAEMIRKAGKQTAGADTVLAHITPEEAAKLKAEGGSGQVDPKTGLPHFDAGGKRGDSHAGNASGGYGGGGRDNDKDDDDLDKDITKGIKDSLARSMQGVVGKTAEAMQGRDRDSGSKEQLPALPAIPNVAPETLTLENLNPATPVTTKPYNTKNAKTGAAAGLKVAGIPGAVVGGVLGGLLGREDETHLVSPPNSLTPEKKTTKSAREPNGGNNAAVKAPVVDETTDAKKLTETVAAPTFDDFVGKARKKKGYMSTILGGGVPAGTPQGKKLLGS